MQTRDDIFTQVLVRNNRTTTDGFITDTMLKAWYKDASIWAAAYHKWPFTEEKDESNVLSGETIDYDQFVYFKADSIRILKVGNDLFKKVNFEDYLKYKAEEPNGTEKIFSDFGRTIYINTASGASGTIYAYAQSLPQIDVTNETGITVFTNYDDEGNEAIYEKMSSYLKRREHLVDEAELHDQRAAQKLDEIWKRVLDEQYKYQTAPHSDGLFERVDVINGGLRDDLFHENRFN